MRNYTGAAQRLMTVSLSLGKANFVDQVDEPPV